MTAGFLLCLSKKRLAFGPENEESRRSELLIIENFALPYLWHCTSCRRPSQNRPLLWLGKGLKWIGQLPQIKGAPLRHGCRKLMGSGADLRRLFNGAL